MENADFSRQDSSVGGFSTDSYRTAAPQETAPQQTPLQQKLSAVESRLPGALRQQAAAILLCLVIMAGSFVGFGGAKLRNCSQEARQWYTAGTAADNGYNLNDELTLRANTAANVITTGSSTLGADSTEVLTAQSALDAFTAALDAAESGASQMHALAEANAALGTAIDQLYAKLQEQAADPMKMGAVQGQYGQFNSAQTIIRNLNYNQAVAAYQKETGGFPASLLKALFGIQEVEPFA